MPLFHFFSLVCDHFGGNEIGRESCCLKNYLSSTCYPSLVYPRITLVSSYDKREIIKIYDKYSKK